MLLLTALEVVQPGGWVTMKLPAGSMRMGAILICPKPGTEGSLTVRIKGAGFEKQFKNLRLDQLGNRCATVTSSLPESTLRGDVQVALGAKQSRLEFLIAE